MIFWKYFHTAIFPEALLRRNHSVQIDLTIRKCHLLREVFRQNVNQLCFTKYC